MLSLLWIKSRSNTWLDFQTFNLDSVGTTAGVYVIWHLGNPSQVVRVGQGDIAARLAAHRRDPLVQKYAPFGLRVTWAAVSAAQRDGVERYLADTWNPLVGDAFPDAIPMAVNSPWG